MLRARNLIADIYKYYMEVNGCEPSIMLIQQWNVMHPTRLKIERDKLKEQYDKKIYIQNHK